MILRPITLGTAATPGAEWCVVGVAGSVVVVVVVLVLVLVELRGEALRVGDTGLLQEATAHATTKSVAIQAARESGRTVGPRRVQTHFNLTGSPEWVWRLGYWRSVTSRLWTVATPPDRDYRRMVPLAVDKSLIHLLTADIGARRRRQDRRPPYRPTGSRRDRRVPAGGHSSRGSGSYPAEVDKRNSGRTDESDG